MLRRRVIGNIDWWLIAIAISMALVGLATVYSATHLAASEHRDPFANQLKWLILGVVVMVVVMALDYRKVVKAAVVLHIVAVILLLIVLFVAEPIAGVRRWLSFGGLRFQPSELAKLTSMLTLVGLFSGEHLKERPWWRISLALVVVGVPFVLILRQPDFGTALTLFIPMIILSFVAQRSLKPLVTLFALGALGSIPGWFMLKEYQKTRILAFLDPSYDELGSGYQAIQSKIGIGSGGIFGKGFCESTQVRLDFLPARHTDFIFSVFAEEQGLVGCFLFVAAFVFLMIIGFSIGFRAKDSTGLLLAVGCISLIGVQFLINVAMVLGMLPIAGLPLPFMSYGGSAMITLFAVIGLLESVQMRRYAF